MRIQTSFVCEDYVTVVTKQPLVSPSP